MDGRFAKKHRAHEHDFAFSGLIACANAAARWSARSRSSATSIIIAPAMPISARATRPPAAASMCARKRWKRSSRNCSAGCASTTRCWNGCARRCTPATPTSGSEHEEAIERLQAEYDRLQKRIDAMYVDKLDGQVDAAFFDKMSAQWREEQEPLPARDRPAPGSRQVLHGRGRADSRTRPQRPKAVRAAGTAPKTPPAQFRTIELLLGGWREWSPPSANRLIYWRKPPPSPPARGRGDGQFGEK